MNKNLKIEKGITLISLVITIIILLILAGISISALTNQGLFKNAKAAQNATEKAEAEQGQRLNEYEDEINKYLSNNDKKEETESTLLDPLAGSFGVHIPANQWHTLEVLDSGSVLFEVKDGPYTPLGENDLLK